MLVVQVAQVEHFRRFLDRQIQLVPQRRRPIALDAVAELFGRDGHVLKISSLERLQVSLNRRRRNIGDIHIDNAFDAVVARMCRDQALTCRSTERSDEISECGAQRRLPEVVG